MENIVIPVGMAIIVDDVGWFNGNDERMMNGSARSGIPRFHTPEDIKALNAVAEGLGIKIGCSIVLGEWDKKNRLRGVPHVTPNPDTWDAVCNSKMKYAEDYFEALESSTGLEYYVHGLMHAYYKDDGKLLTARQYYPTVFDECGKDVGFDWLPKDEFRTMIDLFSEIYNDWGFKKELKTFVSPCGCRGTTYDAGNIAYAEVLREYGIEYWANSWMNSDNHIDLIEGMITSKGRCICPWNAYGMNPKHLKPLDRTKIDTHICGHLANFIRINPEDNFEYIDAWVKHFDENYNYFGNMISVDNAESSSQTFYSKFAKVEKCADGYSIDFTEVDAMGAIGLKKELFVSLKDGTSPKAVIGGTIALYEEKAGYKTYKITRDGAASIKINI